MQIGENVQVESSAELAWKRLPEEDQREISMILARMVGGPSGTIDRGGFKVFYQLSRDGGTVTVVSVATPRESDILRRW